MFNVICINENWTYQEGLEGSPTPKFGREYKVVGISTIFGTDYFCLEGFPDVLEYHSQYFAKTDGPDEQELHEQHIDKLTAQFVDTFGELPIVRLDPVAYARSWERIVAELRK